MAAAPDAVAVAGPHVRRLISSDSVPAGGFTPGTILLGRYRIIGLLGRGGMGEVYRADDLKLGQAVALKFLPRELADDPVRRERFFAEVRITRQVSHPNICRVYDIAELEEATTKQPRYFLTMEYIDGEDLASLLQRIGYLSNEKALDLARQLVAGLAAAHERGVLHRDLKPANIMVDGRGRVRITDFGLAVATSDETQLTEVAGTPAYMAPEQLAGKGATVRSDIYALGLVLYELYTGKRAFKAGTLAELRAEKESAVPTAPSELRAEVDPVVERMIMRCLERDPRQRPASVAQAAAALPGGDPLAAVIAAGETPSPEMVAAAGSREGLRPLVAVLLLLAFVVSAAAMLRLQGLAALVERVTPPKSPAFLVEHVRETIKKLGYTDPPADSAYGFDYARELIESVRENDKSATRWRALNTANPIRFWYRQRPRLLLRKDTYGFVTKSVSPGDPVLNVPGEVLVITDGDGRLRLFEAVPSPRQSAQTAATSSADWSLVLAESPYVVKAFTPSSPQWNPLQAADSRAAWEVDQRYTRNIPVRLEAAAVNGRIVSAQIIDQPWSEPLRDAPGEQPPPPNAPGLWVIIALLVTVFASAFVVARRNLRLGRGDRRGAIRIVAVTFGLAMLSWTAKEHHVAAVWEVGLLWEAFVQGGGLAVWLGAMYIAVEPFVRRRWPQMLVSWTRAWSGEWRDSLVGRDVLVGCASGMCVAVLITLEVLLPGWLGFAGGEPLTLDLSDVSPMGFVGRVADSLRITGLLVPLGMLLLFLLLRIALRREWIALVVWAVTLSAMSLESDTALIVGSIQFVENLLFFVILRRFGLGALAVAMFVLQLMISFPLTMRSSEWYAGYGYAALATSAALALYGFKTALAGRRLLEFREI